MLCFFSYMLVTSYKYVLERNIISRHLQYIYIYIYTSTVTHTVFILHAYFNSNTILKQTSVVFLKTIYLPRRCISKPIIRTHSDIFDLEIFSEYLMIVAILHLYFSIVATDSFNHSRFSNLLTSNIIH